MSWWMGKTKEECEERRQRAICDKVSSCHEMVGEHLFVHGVLQRIKRLFIKHKMGY